MKILVLGAGVIGTTYAWQLSKNIRIVESTPVFLLAPLMKMQYKTPSIQQFFEENIQHGMIEVSHQYQDVFNEGKRLHVNMSKFEGYKKYYVASSEKKS